MVLAVRDVVLNVYSDMNPHMDALFVVNEQWADQALNVLDRAFDAWFEDEMAEAWCWGEWLEFAMKEARIPYEVYYKEEEEDE